MELLIVLIFSVIFSGCAGIHYRTGESYLKQKKYPEAINSLETVLEKNPGYPNAHTLLGIVYYKTEMYDRQSRNLKLQKNFESAIRGQNCFWVWHI